MLRHCLKQKLGFNMPIKTIGLQVRGRQQHLGHNPVVRCLPPCNRAEDDEPKRAQNGWLQCTNNEQCDPNCMPAPRFMLQLYEVEGRDPTTGAVERTQWLSYGSGPGQLLLQGQKLLIVDEVGDRACAAAGTACPLTVPHTLTIPLPLLVTMWVDPAMGLSCSCRSSNLLRRSMTAAKRCPAL